MTALDCFIVGPMGDDLQAALAALARELGLTIVPVSTLAALRSDRRFSDASRPLVIIAEMPADALDVSAAIAFAGDQGGRSFTLWVADTIAPNDYKQLVRTGAAEWINPRDGRHELREIIERMVVATPPRRAATIVSFLPSKGGVGNTSLVVEVATYLAGRRKRDRSRLAVLDLNFQGGTLADALDLEPRFDVAEIVDRPERLDEHLVDVFTSRHAKGFDVFACPLSRINPEGIKPEIVFAFIDAIASRYATLLFDLPVQWTSWTDDLLRGSDGVVACGGESIPALRRLTATFKHLDDLAVAGGKVAAVVNAVETGVLGRVSRQAMIDKALSGRRTFLVRRDHENARQALDVGRPLMELAPQSRIARDVRPLGKWVEGQIDHQPEPRRAHTAKGAFA